MSVAAIKAIQGPLLEANKLVTAKNLGRQDAFLNRLENLLDTACLAVLDALDEAEELAEVRGLA